MARSRWRRGAQYTAAAVIIFLGAYAIGDAVAGPVFFYPCSLNGLEAHGAAQASVLYYSNGTELGTLGATSNRLPVGLNRISPLMRKAIVDTEDRRFYSNDGIDFIGILRSLKDDVFAGGIVQGGSTIEQQLVRNIYLSPQQTLTRKLTEACLAVELDRKWSKDRILAAYLNDIYFGQQAYGIEAAARTYFDEPASKLTLDQAALIAGLPQAPSTYDPITAPQAARQRRAEVLQAMLTAGDISPGAVPSRACAAARLASRRGRKARRPARTSPTSSRRNSSPSTAPAASAKAGCTSTRRSPRRNRPRRHRPSSARSAARETRLARSSRSIRERETSRRWRSRRPGSRSRSTSPPTPRDRRARRSRCSSSPRRSAAG